MDTVQLTTSDGHDLTADIARPDGDPVGAAVLCHPHPQYGGNRFNAVVAALFEALPAAGFTTIRFDFRREFADGVGERLDVVAALDELDGLPGPRVLVGYSFGAVVALTTADPRIAAVVAIAPPLATRPVDPPTVPTLVLTPRHDQFSPPDATMPIVAGWTATTVDVVESADHFLAGHTSRVAERVVQWLSTDLSPPGGTP